MVRINDDYRITKSVIDVVLEKRKVTQNHGKGKQPKEIGKEYWTAIGYFKNVSEAVKGLLKLEANNLTLEDSESLYEYLSKLKRVMDKYDDIANKIGGLVNE